MCLTRSPEVATYSAVIPRDDDEKFGAVFVLDRLRIKSRYRLEANHDFECILDQDEMEEAYLGQKYLRTSYLYSRYRVGNKEG